MPSTTALPGALKMADMKLTDVKMTDMKMQDMCQVSEWAYME